MHVPHYLAQTEYPDAAATLVESVAEISGLRLPVGELRAAGERVRAAIDAQVGEHPEVAEVVRALEEQYDAFVAAARPLAARPGLAAADRRGARRRARAVPRAGERPPGPRRRRPLTHPQATIKDKFGIKSSR